MTLPEVLLWKALKGAEIKFRRQHPIGPYVVDFYCPAARLIVEVDGIAHDMGDRPDHDARRAATLVAEGYTLVRVLATDILADVGRVAETIVESARPLRQSLRDCHLPTSGEDLQDA